jgi:hypothetical protein
MAAPQKPKAKTDEIELHPDAWERFGEFVKRIARAGPQHRPSKLKSGKPAQESKEKDRD